MPSPTTSRRCATWPARPGCAPWSRPTATATAPSRWRAPPWRTGADAAGRGPGRGGRGAAGRGHRRTDPGAVRAPGRRPGRRLGAAPHPHPLPEEGIAPGRRGRVTAGAGAVASTSRSTPACTGSVPSRRTSWPCRGDPVLRLALEGVFTHLAVADEPDRPETDAAARALRGRPRRPGGPGIDPGTRHAANSAGLLAHPPPTSTWCASGSPSTASARRRSWGRRSPLRAGDVGAAPR